MYRVITDIKDHRGNRILEVGPWLVSAQNAENWAETLRGLGYKATVEPMQGSILNATADTSLSDALASMA